MIIIAASVGRPFRDLGVRRRFVAVHGPVAGKIRNIGRTRACEYGADLLRRAVNQGYEEGFRAGQADRDDNWRFDPENCDAFSDATYGYDGYYVDVSEYQYYFREGFRRGYDDGYNDRSQYGLYSNGSHSILADVLSLILDLRRY